MSLNLSIKRLNKNIISDAFHQVALDHFPYIRANNLFSVMPVEGVDAEIYKGDFHGLLDKLGLDRDYHRVQTAFNGLLSPLDYAGDTTTIQVITIEYLIKLTAVHNVVSDNKAKLLKS